jgi:hypothetical protein
MKCPHCGLGIHFEEQEPEIIYPKGNPQKAELGVELVHGICPNCEEMIAVAKTGRYKIKGDEDSGFADILSEEIIYPKGALPKVLDSSIPETYRNDYKEAYLVLDSSSKASAAISRRLLQHILLEDYHIKKGSLDKQIEEFIHKGGIPSHITEAVDAVRNVGNLAAHPIKNTNTGEIVEVEPGEAEWLLEVIDALFDFTFVQPSKLKDRQDKLNKKLTSMGKPPLKK